MCIRDRLLYVCAILPTKAVPEMTYTMLDGISLLTHSPLLLKIWFNLKNGHFIKPQFCVCICVYVWSLHIIVCNIVQEVLLQLAFGVNNVLIVLFLLTNQCNNVCELSYW